MSRKAVGALRTLGRSTPIVRRVARDLTEHLAGMTGETVRLALELAAAGERHLAYELLDASPAARRTLGPRAILTLGAGLADWGSVDAFSCLVLGHAWRGGQVPDSLIVRWARSADHWRRRAAIVATVPLNARSRGGAGDPGRTLALVRLLAADREDMVVKAISWALRELAKRDRQAVQRFLVDAGATLAPRVLREVRRKLATGRKDGLPHPAARPAR